MPNWTEEDYAHLQARQKKKAPANAAPKKASSKSHEQTPRQKLQALGRLKAGTMNATEARFAQLLDQKKLVGEVLWWKFEAIKLILAPNTSLTVDFNVMMADGLLVMIDVKGAKAIFTDDARAKMKIAADCFPFVFRVAYPKPKKEGGGWHIEEI